VATILDSDGNFAAGDPPERCDHGVTFDEEAAASLLGDWKPKTDAEFIVGNPAVSEIRKRWPRLVGPCPKGCGFDGIGYASYMHYLMGDY
jgi:hypothetical protein